MTRPRLAPLIDDYLTVRRRLGFKLDKPEALLTDFADYVDRIGHDGPITVELALAWVVSSSSGRASRAARLAAVRGFARHQAAFEPATEIPPAGLLGRGPRRKQPHIYSDEEIAALLNQASLLSPRDGLCPRTYVTLFGLLASTGLRPSEACRLEVGDVDLIRGVLTVRETKFRKSRLVPMHPTTTQALTHYAAFRDAAAVASRSARFFRTERTLALTADAVYSTFARLRQHLGWTSHGRARRPRVCDLRHTFAVRRLLGWYADGVDVNSRILALSTYLGHAGVADTYWYLSAVPELMAIASQRFERLAAPDRGQEDVA